METNPFAKIQKKIDMAKLSIILFEFQCKIIAI